MKKFYKASVPVFFIFLFILSNLETSLAFSITRPQLNKIYSPGNISTKYLKASEFVKLTANEFSDLTGKKLNLIERLSFTITKMRLKHDLKKNPNLTITAYVKQSKHAGSFNFLWFILGLAAPIIGIFTGSIIALILVAISPVVIAYATKQDKEKIKSVWLGFGIGILLLSLIVALLVASLGAW